MLAVSTSVVSREQLIDGLADRCSRGAVICTIETVTDARLKKTGNTLGPVFKRSIVNVVLNFRYEGAVNRQREREGIATDFEASPRTWGERISGTPFVQYKGKLYVEAKVQRSLSHAYELADGSPISAEDVRPFLPASRSEGRQGVEREIILRDYSIDSIVGLTIDGERFDVADTELAALECIAA